MLILIETAKMPVMHYRASDTSPEAIAAEVARAGFPGESWRQITQSEYLAIRNVRPRPEPKLPQPPENIDDALALMLEMANQVHELKAESAAHRAEIDRINATPIPTALDLIEVNP